MSKNNYGFDYNDYERRRNKVIDSLTTFLGESETFDRLKAITNVEELKKLLTEAIEATFPNPFNKPYCG